MTFKRLRHILSLYTSLLTQLAFVPFPLASSESNVFWPFCPETPSQLLRSFQPFQARFPSSVGSPQPRIPQRAAGREASAGPEWCNHQIFPWSLREVEGLGTGLRHWKKPRSASDSSKGFQSIQVCVWKSMVHDHPSEVRLLGSQLQDLWGHHPHSAGAGGLGPRTSQGPGSRALLRVPVIGQCRVVVP